MGERLNVKKNPTEEVKRAVAEIEYIKGNVWVRGANDFEIPVLDRIIESLKRGEILPEEALRQAINIENRKQDDH